MKKINKNFLIFTFITSLLSLSMLLIFYKLVPTVFLRTVYFCQQLINSYSIQIPHQINLIILAFIAIILFIFLTKVFVTIVKIHRIKNYLIKNKKELGDILPLVQKVGLKNKISIVKDSKPFAFCLGIRSPHVYISTKTVSIMTKRQLEAILLHEKYHLERADSLTFFIGSLPKLLFPFFPVLPKLLERYKIEREIKADNQAVEELGTTKPVIKVLKKLLENPSVSPAFLSSIADTNSLEIRIKSLINKKSKPPRIRILDVLISVLSLGFILTSIVTPVQAIEIRDNQDVVMVCLEGNECARWCKEHNTVIPYKQNMSYPYSSVR